MPLVRISGNDAFNNTRHNPQNNWPTRDEADNRVEPITKPAFKPSFTITSEDSVFTIGSCFARNVEAQLERLGFNVPMRSVKIFEDHESSSSDSNVFNNYSVPSILNELQWAADPDHPFNKDTGLVEVSKDAYCDLHLTRLLRPVPLEDAMRRRERIAAGVRSVTQCRVVIITLGLVEVWWDNEAKRYLNIAPPKQVTKRQPDRFELHVLGYNEIVDYLDRIIALLDRVCVEGYRIVLTVSPIPLGFTFTKQDVIVANCYSKSVLRAAAEQVCYRYDHVDYFPSYESVTLSDRKVALDADMRHATPVIISTNVNRMIAAYTNDDTTGETAMAKAQTAEKSRAFTAACRHYERALQDEPSLVQASLGLGRCLGELGNGTEALQVLKPILDKPEVRAEAAKAISAVCRRNKLGADFPLVQPILEELSADLNASRELILTTFELGDHAATERYCASLMKRSPRTPISYEYMGKIAYAQGDLAAAERHLKEAVAHNQNIPTVFGVLGRVKLELGHLAEAEDAFSRALSLNPRTRDAVVGMQDLVRRREDAMAASHAVVA